MRKNLSMIVAVDENNAIGKDNALLWHLPNDLKHFKELTTGKTIIMGKKTYLSLPKRPLPNRISIVLCNDDIEFLNQKEENVIKVVTIEEVFYALPKSESFVIGGGMIYKLFLPHIETLYLTQVFHQFDADTFFPKLDDKIFKLIKCSEQIQKDEKHEYPYQFQTWKNKESLL